MDGFVPRHLSVEEKPGATDLQERVDLFQEQLSADIGEPVLVEFDLIPVEMIEIRGKRPEAHAEK
jgi:hypothetical protein